MMYELKKSTLNSPTRTLSKFELMRYLDYCSEVLSLIGKVAALYAQSLPDDVVVKSVTEIEGLSTGFSRKIWQKLIILNDMDDNELESKDKGFKKNAGKKLKKQSVKKSKIDNKE